MSDIHRAAMVRAPGGYDVTNIAQEVFKVTVGSSSTSAQDTGVSRLGEVSYVTFVCTEDCYIRFGGEAVDAATSDDWPMTADQEYQWAISTEDRYFRAIRAGSSDGTLKWYKSS